MKNILSRVLVLGIILISSGCESYLDVNENPNQSTSVPNELIIKGMQLADVQLQLGHTMRISQLWTGQLKGLGNLYKNLYVYNIAPEETNGDWSFVYHGIVTQNRIIQADSEDNLIKGIGNIIEAHAIGTMAALFGDIPYSKYGTPDPEFDSQTEVFNQVQALLDAAIVQLSSVTATRVLSQDLLVGKNAAAWTQVAHTLKARFYLMTKNYQAAYTEALDGVSTDVNNMSYAKGFSGYGSTLENSNLYYIVLDGSRGGDFSSADTFVQGLLDPAGSSSRNHAKTDESRRRDYLKVSIDERASTRITGQNVKMPMVSNVENLLILAESSARLGQFNTALGHLNGLRSYLNSGKGFIGSASLTAKYSAFVAADFEAGGIENASGISADKALLREILEERYVSLFGTHLPFFDFARVSKTDPDIALAISPTSGGQHAQRFPIAQNEINGNANAPSPIPSIFDPTPVNK